MQVVLFNIIQFLNACKYTPAAPLSKSTIPLGCLCLSCLKSKRKHISFLFVINVVVCVLGSSTTFQKNK